VLIAVKRGQPMTAKELAAPGAAGP
jgi:hypothetical protein